MRYFPGMIFLGNGEHSARLAKLLHARLDSAVSLLGGLQQPDDPCEPPSEARTTDRSRCEAELHDAAKDIVAALLGHELLLGDKLCYPYGDEPLQKWAEKVDADSST
jgi:hypothetical protein